MSVPLRPNIAEFWGFIRNVMRITQAQLPDDSPYPGWAYNISLMLVNRALMVVPSPDPAYPGLYALAVYNLAADRLVNFAQDQDGQTIFADFRNTLGLDAFVSGVVSSTGDEGTSMSLTVPQQFERFTVFDLQTLKTPWGRTYIGFAQMAGPNVWGLNL